LEGTFYYMSACYIGLPSIPLICTKQNKLLTACNDLYLIEIESIQIVPENYHQHYRLFAFLCAFDIGPILM